MNYQLNYDIRDKIINDIFYKFFTNKSKFCDDIYCSEDELSEMIDSNMIIGSHAHSHRMLSKISDLEQYEDLIKSYNYLKKIVRQIKVIHPSINELKYDLQFFFRKLFICY